MTDIDDRIRGALDADDKAFLASLDEGRGLFSQMGDVLAGPLGGWSKLIFAVAFVLGITLLYLAWRFFTATSFEDAVWWGMVTLAALLMQGFIKEWFYARMNLLSMLRELKRLQLQVAMLSEERG
ncbi:DUF6768 family protein [Erythrobacter sp.]|jgi:hypothetical protein|uniref:DUF6768 family protein n=1 Tax=Erythrobacteraceae TaxID=335929 RepID=UPI001B1EA865|nr:DUF6768 family protein [Erythrobacter sp.]MBO6525812.1 hypothetical protein [Erythrobacter sp.]MBO6529513.1 hypothetical protein [Erythrobacter sp.]MBO6768030.1 hypothetical protein [Erythrobacter sp.]